jgi:hypothetical protein
MATARKDPQQVDKVNLKPSESGKGVVRRARSVPTSPDRRSSPSPAPVSDNASRPASSLNTRTTSSRSTTTSSSAASSSHGKTMRSASSSVGGASASARQTNAARRRAEKPGATSVWPAAGGAVTNASSSKDVASRAAKSPSTAAQKTRPAGVEKAAASSSVKLKTKPQKTTAGAGKTQAAPPARAPPGTVIAKKSTGAENYVPIQRTTSVPAARPTETLKNEEQEVDELLMQFDEKESISTSSIEEHLQERLPDPVDLKSVDLDSSKTTSSSSSQEECKDQEENTGDILEEKRDGKDSEDLSSTGDKACVGLGSSDINIPMEEAVDEPVKPAEAVDEAGLKRDVCCSPAEPNEAVGQNELNEAAVVGETTTEPKEAEDEAKIIKQVDCETASKEVASTGAESRDDAATMEREPLVAAAAAAAAPQEEKAKAEEKTTQPTKAVESAKWRTKDEGRSNEATEEGRGKSTTTAATQERKNKVMALVGRFETAMSG